MSNFEAFLRPNTLKTKNYFKLNLRLGYVYIEKSFDTIFNMGIGGTIQRPSPLGMGRDMVERVKDKIILIWDLSRIIFSLYFPV